MIIDALKVSGSPTVDRKNQEKLYIQVMRLIVEEIGKGTWNLGERIPSENELSFRYGVSKITVRQALTNLSADGYLVKVQGKGTFVAGNRPVVGLTMKTRFTEGLFGRGVEETREVVERGFEEPPAEVRRLLGEMRQPIGSPRADSRTGCRSRWTSPMSRRGCCRGSRSRTWAPSRCSRPSRSAARGRSSGCARLSRSPA